MFKRYRQLIIEDPNPAPTDDEIQAIETTLGAKLPDDYLDFLTVGNGASMDDYIVKVPLHSVVEGMSFRFFTTYSGVQSLIKELERQRKSPYAPIPNRVLPIAEDSNGSYLYLDLRRAGVSPVLAFVYGLPAWTGLQQEDELVHLAANFSAYIDMLKFDEDEYKELLQKAIALRNTSQIDFIMEYLDLALPNWRQQWGMS